MTDYVHKSLKPDGSIQRGRISAPDERAAFQMLRDKGLSPFELQVHREAVSLSSFLPMARVPGGKTKARYVRQLATLLKAGLPLLDAVESMTRDGHSVLAQASQKVRASLRAGDRLSLAMQTHLPFLPDYVCRLAELGEQTGSLGDALTDAADRLEREEALKSEIRSALTYPAFLGVTGVFITLFMFFFVIPRFETLLGDNRDSLPAISQFVLGASAFMREHTLVAGLIFATLVAGLISAVQSEIMRLRIRRFLDTVPGLGTFLMRADLAGWSRTVGIAIKNGADLQAALDLGGRSANSPRFVDGLKEARKAVRSGEPLDEAMASNLPLSPTLVDLLRTGRQASALSDMLLFIADLLDGEARERAKKITALAEPIAIVLISMIVGGLVLAIVLAMTSIYQFDI